MKISHGMGIRRGMRVLVVAVAGRMAPSLPRPRLPLRHGTMHRYIEDDPGRGVLGVVEMRITVLEGSSVPLHLSIRSAHGLILEDIMLCLLRLGRCSMSRSDGRSFEKWVPEPMVSSCS